jgi:hypothetical protein
LRSIKDDKGPMVNGETSIKAFSSPKHLGTDQILQCEQQFSVLESPY